MTVGVDIGDRYPYLCFIDTESGEVVEEGRLRTTPEAFRRRFGSDSIGARGHRGGDALAVGEPAARGVRPRGLGGQPP